MKNAKFNPIRDGGDKKPPPTSSSPVTSTKLEISPKNFELFYQTVSLYLVPVPNY